MKYVIPHRANQAGFSLLELALVVAVLGLLMGAAINPMRHFLRQQWIERERGQLATANELLLAYAVRHGRLPCPDHNGDGREDNNNGSCGESAIGSAPSDSQRQRIVSGTLPWLDIGAATRNAHGHRYRYAVTLHYADEPASADPTEFPRSSGQACPAASMHLLPQPSFTLCSLGGIDIRAADGGWRVREAPFVVWSAGAELSARGSGESENADGDRVFVARPWNTQFDDQVSWLSAAQLAWQGGLRPGY